MKLNVELSRFRVKEGKTVQVDELDGLSQRAHGRHPSHS